MKSNHSPNVRLLIIDDNDQEAAYVKEWLEKGMRIPWEAVYCHNLEEAHALASGVDLIILKPEMECIESPEEVFDSLNEQLFEIPIIVLTSESDSHDLTTLVMEHGAADTVVRGQFSRLVDAIEFALIRQKHTSHTRKNAEDTLEESAKQNAEEEERHRQIMRMFSSAYSAG